MIPEKTQRKIERLRAKYTSDDSVLDFGLLETEYAKLIDEKGMVENPVFKKIVEDAETKINEINALLLNDETLTEKIRDRLLAERRVWRFVFERFGLVPHDQALQSLDNLIDTKLEDVG